MGLLDNAINKDDVFLISSLFINSRARIRVKTVYNTMVYTVHYGGNFYQNFLVPAVFMYLSHMFEI